MIIANLLKEKKRPLVMGIVNCTPDSFFSQSRNFDKTSAIKNAIKMAEAGADILDIGGESTRPGSEYVSEEEELQRIIPVIKEITAKLNIPVSVDTRKSAVAFEAIKAGASIINDVSALNDEPEIVNVVRKSGCDIILMHSRGTPLTMQENISYTDTIKEIIAELEFAVDKALGAGIDRSNITIDPGLGFSKSFQDNLDIIKAIPVFKKLGYPVLIGHSRKSFIGEITGKKIAEERLAGTLAAGVISILRGADILRVHDVSETIDIIKVTEAIEGQNIVSF